jgi:hypothetical protein
VILKQLLRGIAGSLGVDGILEADDVCVEQLDDGILGQVRVGAADEGREILAIAH